MIYRAPFTQSLDLRHQAQLDFTVISTLNIAYRNGYPRTLEHPLIYLLWAYVIGKSERIQTL